MKSAVVDTNVFVSALIGSKSCKQIYKLLKEDKFLLVLSEDLLTEIKTTLIKAKFELNKEEIEEVIFHILQKSKMVKPVEKLSVCRDPKDNPVLECAVSGKVDFIVTGDKDLLALKSFRKILIISPRKFSKILK